MKFQWMFLALSCCGLLSLVGCGAPTSVAEEDSLEHHIPDHKPINLIDAWSQLKMRMVRLRLESTARELSELHDIIIWLPELAADSDLKRVAWEKVNAISQKVSTQTMTIASAIANRDEVIGLLDRNVDVLINAGRSTLVRPANYQNAEEGNDHD